MRYRKKPVEVEAWQVGSDDECPDWIFSARDRCDESGYWFVVCANKEGTTFNVKVGDYLVTDGYGAFWLEKKEYFEQTYEVVE